MNFSYILLNKKYLERNISVVISLSTILYRLSLVDLYKTTLFSASRPETEMKIPL